MPEVFPEFETSFQNMIDHEYSGKDRATPEFPNGTFGIIPGARPPQWTLSQLYKELVREYTTMVDNKRAIWENSFDQVVGIIQATVNNYAALLGQVNAKTYSNSTEEWSAYEASRAQ